MRRAIRQRPEARNLERLYFPMPVTDALKTRRHLAMQFRAKNYSESSGSGRFLDATKGSFAFHVNNRTMWHRRQPAAGRAAPRARARQ